MNELKCQHEDPYVRAVVDHMIEVYRQVGCPLVGEEPPFDPIPDELFDDRAIEIVYEAFDEMRRMGILAPETGDGVDRRGPLFPVGWICPHCAAAEVPEA